MLMIIEILLTVKAYRRGWGWRALIPGGTMLCLGILLGVIAAANGMSEHQTDTMPLYLLPVELVMVGVLGWMATRDYTREEEREEEIPAIEGEVVL